MEKFKKYLKNIKVPDSPDFVNSDENEMNQFIQKLKIQDQKDRKNLKNFQVFFIIVLIFYFGLFILNPDPYLTIIDRLVGSFFVIAFLLFLLFLKRHISSYTSIKYDEMMLLFLKKAEKRYRFLLEDSYILIPFLLLIDVGSCTAFVVNYWPAQYGFISGILVFQVIFALIMSLGLIIAKRKWRRNKSEIYYSIKNLINEFQMDNNTVS